MHEGGGRWVSSNKLVELKKKKKARDAWEPLGQGPAGMRNAGKLDLRTWTPRLCREMTRVGPGWLTWGALFNLMC